MHRENSRAQKRREEEINSRPLAAYSRRLLMGTPRLQTLLVQRGEEGGGGGAGPENT